MEGVTKDDFRICARKFPAKRLDFKRERSKRREEKKKGIQIKVAPIDIEGMPKRRRSLTN